MDPMEDLCSGLSCRSVWFQGFENDVKNLQGLCEGGKRKFLKLLPFLFLQRLQRVGDRRILEKTKPKQNKEGMES